MSEHQLAHATFHVMGDSVTPSFWTAYFGVEPDTAISKGQYFITPSGRPSRTPGRVGLWGVGSKLFVLSDQLEPHLRYLAERLNLSRPGLRDLLAREGVEVRFWCYWNNESGNREPDVPDDIRTMMESLGGTVEIDEYR
ncbi:MULTISPECIES: DUF4279 domain-containing protein [Caballeronia]|uniref:DUF4279 domain-containing protein n=2 Tax=Burkholderiaceae TaxID=119060 RepID=UPI0009DB047B|nr:DUF4279 domain-containing protein [Caballeronia sp. CLC5]MCE4541986.1 DUF4279 domain-containing protein [Caballeronia sp. PC1]MCE4568968.1 DUF4279 domain-containing protein [Caballeronia sp. CLC5]